MDLRKLYLRGVDILDYFLFLRYTLEYLAILQLNKKDYCLIFITINGQTF